MIAPIRTRAIGSNVCSDHYTRPRAVEDIYRDLALFIGHTGFTNIRRRSPLCHTLPCPSLAIAWRLVIHGAVRPPNALWYVVDSGAFVVLVRERLSACAAQLLVGQEEEELGPFDVWFRPEPLCFSVDAFIDRTLLLHVEATLGTAQQQWPGLVRMYGASTVCACLRAHHATLPCYYALRLLFPSAGLTRSTVNNRMNKKKKELYTAYSSGIISPSSSTTRGRFRG